jgi:hypothetical protein
MLTTILWPRLFDPEAFPTAMLTSWLQPAEGTRSWLADARMSVAAPGELKDRRHPAA